MRRSQCRRFKHKQLRSQGEDSTVERISMSLPPQLLSEFDRPMKSAGFSDRSEVIQTAPHSLIDQSDWDREEDSRNGAVAIMRLSNNYAYSHDSGAETQHRYREIATRTKDGAREKLATLRNSIACSLSTNVCSRFVYVAEFAIIPGIASLKLRLCSVF